MSRIIVTGGAGFIGSNLIKELKKHNHEVTSIDNYSYGLKSNEIKGVNYINEDICNIENISGEFDVCFHLAALSRVQLSFKNSEKYFKVNVFGTLEVMKWAKINNIKVIYAGSSSKHLNPTSSPYAMYKYLGEEICKLYKTSFSLNVEIARFYNVYGPNELVDEINGNVIGIWRKKVMSKDSLPIVGDGEQRRDFIHVFDLVDGLIKIAQTSTSHDDAWELGAGVNYSINELYNLFKLKFNSFRVNIPDQPGNYKTTIRKNNDALDKLGWKPQDRLKNYILNL